ncbi:unnamed protein product [Allacma fusca]|uniref:Uncharacterized protein n=1 Tax=Allacma fusca TaxID=39272 RepID=A0A8J2PH73_9HEXA|nr:unnamed protein product [Allacma fusca]
MVRRLGGLRYQLVLRFERRFEGLRRLDGLKRLKLEEERSTRVQHVAVLSGVPRRSPSICRLMKSVGIVSGVPYRSR